MLDLPIRPRRNRKSAAIRSMMRETSLSPAHLICPLFVHEGDGDEDIASLPGCKRWSIAGLVDECARLLSLGINCVDLFAVVPEEKKDELGSEAWNPDGIIPRAIQSIKLAHPKMTIMTDVALDPFSTEGHDGIVQHYPDGSYEILNDETISALCKQALAHAEAGADIIAPSDMMDGRIAAIRAMLDSEGFDDVSLMSYSAKYASALYGPFRGALGSAPKQGDKLSYQMDPANRREALREAELDVYEGADFLMVKPASFYLDVIAAIREETKLPIAAYQVSGEYLMIKAAAASGWLDERAVFLESLLCIRRAGADMILTYAAAQVAEYLREEL